MISYLMTVAAICLTIGVSNLSLHQQLLKNLSKGAQDLITLLTKSNNNAPIALVLLARIAFTDDLTVFVSKGAALNPEGWYLVGGNKNGSDQAIFLKMMEE